MRKSCGAFSRHLRSQLCPIPVRSTLSRRLQTSTEVLRSTITTYLLHLFPKEGMTSASGGHTGRLDPAGQCREA